MSTQIGDKGTSPDQVTNGKCNLRNSVRTNTYLYTVQCSFPVIIIDDVMSSKPKLPNHGILLVLWRLRPPEAPFSKKVMLEVVKGSFNGPILLIDLVFLLRSLPSKLCTLSSRSG